MQDPQRYTVSDGRLMSTFAVTGSFIEPLVFPPISLELRHAPNAPKMESSMHAFCNGDVFVESGVLLTSCFSKELQPDANAFEEEFCLRWLHPVGEFGAEERGSVAKVSSNISSNDFSRTQKCCSAWSLEPFSTLFLSLKNPNASQWIVSVK